MKLRDLSLQLFRQHTSSDVVFPDGLTGVVGANGSGKTTIVEAIGFALFGSRALRGKVEDVRTRNAVITRAGRGKRDHEPKITLSLEHEGVVFRIERSLSDAVLYVGGESKPVTSGNKEVSARISAIVGMTYDEFISTYCTEQKGLEFLSGKKGATEREKFIVRMMGYDRLEEMQEILRNDRKEKRAILAGYEASLGNREELDKRLHSEQFELEQIRLKHDEAARSLTKTETEFTSMRERMMKFEDLRQRYVKEREGVNAVRVRLEERTKRLRHLLDAESLGRAELEKVLASHVESRSADDSTESIRAAVEKTKSRPRDASDGLRREELAWRDRASRVSAEREGAVRLLEQHRKKSSRFESLEQAGECPTCGQPLGTSFEQVKGHFADEREKLAGRVFELEKLVTDSGAVPQEVQDARTQVAQIEQEIAGLDRKLQEILRYEQLRDKLDAAAKEKSAVEGEIRVGEDALKVATDRLANLRFSEDEYMREKGAHDASQRLLEVSRLQRVRLEGEVNTKEALVQRSKAELSRYDERRIELEKLRKEVRIFDECDRILTDFRRFVNASIRPRLAELASEYLADLTDGRYTAVELEEDFTPTVIEDGEPKPVISGGEEDILNLCMRISLSHMLAERAGQHFSLLILDEVFGSLDEGRRSNVLSLLEKLRKRFEQIVIITHLDDVKEGVQHLIEVAYDEGSGTARISSAEEVYPVGAMAFNV